MARVLDICELIDWLRNKRISSKELIGRITRNLYSIEQEFMNRDLLHKRNTIRAIVAYVKLLYDYAQQSELARMYLSHRIKLLEVREFDLQQEYSVLRDRSSISSLEENNSY